MSAGQLDTVEVGDGPPVVWLHGYTMDSSLWAPLWSLLPGHRHIGIDLPGHGRSPLIPRGLTLPELAATVATTIRHTGATRLVAQSWGSCVALQVAIDHPGLVSRLVLGAPTVAGAPAAPGTAERTRELMGLHRFTGVGPHLAELWMSSPPDIFLGARDHPELYATLTGVIERHPWQELATGAMAGLTRASHSPDQLAGITADTTVLIGDRDMPTFRANAELLGSVVPGCRVHSLDSAGHLPLLELPDESAKILADALC